MEHEDITDIATYLAHHVDEIGKRILTSYPALYGAEEALSPLLARMLRTPYPAQTIAIMGGTARGERQNGEIYLIHERDVRRFVLEHPSEIDPAQSGSALAPRHAHQWVSANA